MRITGGRARGIPLHAPRGRETRPATDQLREAVFSSLGPRVEGARVADLFAGTGSYGLEALSRGATSGCFVENNRQALVCLRANLAAVLRSCERERRAWQVLALGIEQMPAGLGPSISSLWIPLTLNRGGATTAIYRAHRRSRGRGGDPLPGDARHT